MIKIGIDVDEEELVVFDDDDFGKLNWVSSNGYLDSFCKV